MCVTDARGSFCCPVSRTSSNIFTTCTTVILINISFELSDKCPDGRQPSPSPISCRSSYECPHSYGCTVQHICCPLPTGNVNSQPPHYPNSAPTVTENVYGSQNYFNNVPTEPTTVHAPTHGITYPVVPPTTVTQATVTPIAQNQSKLFVA